MLTITNYFVLSHFGLPNVEIDGRYFFALNGIAHILFYYLFAPKWCDLYVIILYMNRGKSEKRGILLSNSENLVLSNSENLVLINSEIGGDADVLRHVGGESSWQHVPELFF